MPETAFRVRSGDSTRVASWQAASSAGLVVIFTGLLLPSAFLAGEMSHVAGGPPAYPLVAYGQLVCLVYAALLLWAIPLTARSLVSDALRRAGTLSLFAKLFAPVALLLSTLALTDQTLIDPDVAIVLWYGSIGLMVVSPAYGSLSTWHWVAGWPSDEWDGPELGLDAASDASNKRIELTHVSYTSCESACSQLMRNTFDLHREVDSAVLRAYGIAYVRGSAQMTSVTATEARKSLYKLIDDVSDSHEPVQITGKRGSAMLVSEEDWRAVQETLYLVSIPGMRESILEGLATPVSELEDKLDW